MYFFSHIDIFLYLTLGCIFQFYNFFETAMGHHSPFLLKLTSPPCEFSPSLFHMYVSFGTDHFAHPVNKSVLKWIDEHGGYYYFSALRLSLPSVSSLRLTLTLTSGTALSMVANSHHQVRWLFLSSHSHWSFLIFDAQFWKSFFLWLGSFCTLLFLLVLILFRLLPLLHWLLFLFPPLESSHSPRSYSEFLSLISSHFFPNTVSSTSITSPNIFTHPKLWPYCFSWTSISSFNHHQGLSIWTYRVSFSISQDS